MFRILILLFTLYSSAFAESFPSRKISRVATSRVEPVIEKELLEKNLQLGSPIFIRIFKKESILEVWLKESTKEFKLFKKYKICYFSGNLGPKLKVGDRQSPEGFYYVTPERLNPYSSFHLSFNIGYPNAYDRYHGRTGSALMVHGNCVSIGCYAMTDKLIEEIYTLAELALKNKQPFFRVHIFPFRMTESNMKKYKGHKWEYFWMNLKEGYDMFEASKKPPDVNVLKGKYVFKN